MRKYKTLVVFKVKSSTKNRKHQIKKAQKPEMRLSRTEF